MDRNDSTTSRREFVAMATLLGGVSIAAPASAQSFGNILKSAKKVVKAASYSDEEMKVFFDQMSEDMDSKNPVAGMDNPYGQRIAALSQGLESHDGLDLDIKAYLVRDVNAFAMANGTIRVFAGLMDEFTDDEVRYVIGHEIGHVQREHSKKRMQGALNRDAVLSVASTADSGVRRIANSEIGKFFGDVVTAQHSQKHEKEADDYAFAFMQEKGYDAEACATALEKLQAMSGPSDGLAWTKTHPSPKARAKRMRKKLA
ncbi:M48 family metalloprotease [Erythrobacter sp. YT30]|uniref:M48 family metalloprotease n=1 Tax=Erythrobacter sp. YT30 TaxID=1735012 RepID=UPI00076D4C0C|nr:M48 family metalloprotease [Erythrobacter sp. YT30]KWV91653.1 peptidase [Erythrobacter sp. YT30]